MTKMCYHPWVGLDISPQGDIKPCCKYATNIASNLHDYKNSTELKTLKEQFLKGEQPAGCARCWEDEDAGLNSKRVLDFKYVFKEQVPDLNKTAILSIPFGNTCNLACRICYSYSSSKWVTEEKKLQSFIPIDKIYSHTQFYRDKAFMDEIQKLSSDLILAEFPGGEPLLTGATEHLGYISSLPKTASLHYFTNGTIFPNDKFLNEWTKFERVELQLSVDDFGRRFEYNRWPGNWAEVSSNISKFIQFSNANKNIVINVGQVVSIFTVYYLPEFLIWCLKSKLPIPHFTILKDPLHYSITTFPRPVKEAIAAKLSNPKFEGIVKHMMSADNSKEFETTMKYVTLLDRQRNQSFAETFPELHQLIKGYTC